MSPRGRRGFWRGAVLAVAAAAALLAAPVAAAAQSYTFDVTATGGTLTGAWAADASGQTAVGTSAAGGFAITETSPGPFTILGSGTTAGGTTSEAVYFGAAVASSTYRADVALALPAVMPTQVTAPTGIGLTAGTPQTVAISVYNATYGAVSDGAVVSMTPSAGLILTPGANEAQVGQSVYASSVSGTVYATLSAAGAGSYTLQVGSPPGTPLMGGTIPVTVSSTSSGAGCGACGVSSGGSAGVGSSVTVNGATGTVVLSATFPADAAQTLTSSDGAVTLTIPAGAIAAGGTVSLQAVEFGPAATTALLAPAQLPAYEHPLGLSFDFTATVNGVAVATFAAPITALFSLASVQGSVHDPANVDLMRIGSDGTLTYVGGKWTGSQVSVPMTGFTPYTLLEVDRTFPDIDGLWAEKNIELMADKFVVQGFPGGDFQPQAPVTRAQFTAMLLRLLNIPVDTAATTTFSDVTPGAWYYGSVATAAEKGIVQGYSSTSFGPNDPITREELVTMFVRAAEMEGWLQTSAAASGGTKMDATFADAGQVDSWARQDMAIAVAAGLIRGRTPTTLVPLGITTRAEAATWVSRLFRQFM